MILRGIYLARPQDSAWYYHVEQDPQTAWPEWKAIHALVDQRSSLSIDEQMFALINDKDPLISTPAKRAWSEYGDSIYRAELESAESESDEAVAANPNPALESSYGARNAFFPTANYLIENIAKIRHIPTIVVQGARDRVTPLSAAIELSQAWPELQLIIASRSGHAAYEPDTVSFLVDATNRLAKKQK